MKGRCVQCRKTLVKRVGVFCGHFYKERGPYPPCQTMWCGGWYADQSKDGEREVESRYEAGRNSNHMNTYFQCNICHFRNIQVRSLERSNLKYKTLLETIRRKSLDTSWIREPGTIIGNMWMLCNTTRVDIWYLGLEEWIPLFVPYPLTDEVGMRIAYVTLSLFM